VAVVADLGTAMQVVQAEVVAADALDQTALDQTVILDQTIVGIKITAAEEFKDKGFQAATACAIIAKVKIVIKRVAAVVQVARDIPVKMIVIKVLCRTAALE
jgi:hypothetical protein